MKKEFLLAIVILTGFTSVGQSRPHGVISNSELRYFELHKPKLPEWDTLAKYYCSDLCIECGCYIQEDYYEKDSQVYCRNGEVMLQNGGKEFWIIFKFDLLTKEITLYDKEAEKIVSVSEYRKYLRENLKGIPR